MEMLAIHGVGEKKLDNFGNEFIEVVCQHSEAVAG
jgi:superfamily II DNA helicase RecQ